MAKSTSNSSQPQSVKRCTKCGKKKPATTEHFQANPRVKSGLNAQCKECVAEYKREYAEKNAEKLRIDRRERYEANRDDILAQQAEYRAANPDKVKASKRAEYERNRENHLKRVAEYREANRDEISRKSKESWPSRREKENKRRRQWDIDNPDRKREASRRWKSSNKEKVKASGKKYYEENRDRLRRRIQKRYKADPVKARTRGRLWYQNNKDIELERRKINRQKNLDQYRKSGAAKESARRARKASLPDTFRTDDWLRCLEYFEHKCAACGRPADLFLKLSIDHFIPLSSPDCPGNIPANIIPLCHGDTGCNASKGNKDALTWAAEKFGKNKAEKFIARVEGYFASLK